MANPRLSVSDLTPDEIELLALEHVETVFIELRAAGAVAREKYHPVKLIKRHPLIAISLSAAAVFLLFRYLRPKPAPHVADNAPPAHAPNFFDSLLSGLGSAAGRALPGLIVAWISRQSKPQ